MRVTSDLWTAALIRRVFSEGGFGAVLRRGAAEAGAIFVIARERERTCLFGPAPQANYDSARPHERAWSLLTPQGEAEIESRLEREIRFDPDLWVIEIEPGRTPAAALFPVTRA